MATHDYVVDNQSAPNFRSDLNNALAAIVSTNSNATAPSVTFANMLWYDTANNQIKKRNEANSAWITLGTVDEANSKFTPNAAITTSEIAAATLVTSSDTIASNDNDTTIPTTAAVIDYAERVLTFSANTATTSGTAFDFTGLPSTVREIEIYWQNVSLSDASDPAVQLIVSGSPVTSGYQSSSSSAGADSTSTAGFHMYSDGTARYHTGIMRIVKAASGVWVESHSGANGGGDHSGGGYISGVGTVDGIRVTRVNGSGTFDLGNVSISYR
jgi:hypothetical protein